MRRTHDQRPGSHHTAAAGRATSSQVYEGIPSPCANVLGVVGARYDPVQNEESCALLDSLVDEGRAHYETAGAPRGGETFVTMRLPEALTVRGMLGRPVAARCRWTDRPPPRPARNRKCDSPRFRNWANDTA
ncbi:DUF932 domain-containing protein [Mycobacterium sp. URHB0021]